MGLDLKLIKSLPLIQGIGISSPGIGRGLLLSSTVVAAFRVLVWVAILIVDKSLFLKEILASGIARLINL